MVWPLSRILAQLPIHHGNRSFIRKESTNLDNRGNNHKVDNLEKRFLVWTGKYKSIADVPAFVPQNVMERARNRMRIRIANIMMAATVVGCAIMVYLGKKDKEKGGSITQMNVDWHKQYNEELQQKEAKKSTK